MARSGDLGGIFRLNNWNGTVPPQSQGSRRAGKPRQDEIRAGRGAAGTPLPFGVDFEPVTRHLIGKKAPALIPSEKPCELAIMKK